MTHQEMTLIFGQMLLAWPSAPMFQGGVKQLGPTINLWAVSMPDVDFWTAKQAVCRMVRTCKFPPTIAEFLQAAKEVEGALAEEAYIAYNANVELPEFLGQFDYDSLKRDGMVRKTIDLAGGPESLTRESFVKAYRIIARQTRDLLPALQSPSAPGIGPGQNGGHRQIGGGGP